MTRVEKSIEIMAPPEKVWELLAFDRFPEWDKGTQNSVKSVKYTSDVDTSEDKYRVGAIVQITENRGRVIDTEITESLENEKLSSRANYLNSIVTFILEPIEEGTKFTYSVDYEMSWGILGEFFDSFFARRAVEKDVEKSLENLKSILEK